MDFIKKYIIWFLALLNIVLLIIILRHIFPNNKSGLGYKIIKDTNLLIRYEKELKNDTVIKWYEKIVYKKSEPEIIRFQKIDTVFIEKSKDLDLMLQVKKDDNKLIIKAVNQNGKTLKEYIYEDVSNDFNAVSEKENIFVKSKKFYWNSIISIFNIQWSMSNENMLNYNFGLETGISYKNRIDVNAGLLYSPVEKDLILNSNLKIKF